jgi:hypothetical protein
MRMSLRLTIISVAMVTSLMAQTQESVITKLRTSVTESQAAAASGLAEFKRLVNSKNFQSYGFQSEKEAASASLGQPVVAFLVRLDQLREYQPSGDATRLLTGGDKVLYPVVADGRVRSSIIIDKGSGSWKAASFGGPQLIQRLTQARDRVSPQGAQTIAVEFLALNAYFLGEFRGSDLFLTPLADQPEFNLKAGTTEQASRVFSQLVPAARAYNGLPR